MPDQEYVDIALIELKDANGALVELNDVVDLSVDVTTSTTLVKTMNRKRRARGYRRGVVEVSGSLTVEKKVVPEFDFRRSMLVGETIQLYYDEAEDGVRYHLKDIRITEVGNEAGEDGSSNLKVTFMALDHIELPS